MERWMNKVALITGVSSGIGKAIAESLVHHGMKVVGIARRIDKMKIMSEEWKSMPGKLIPVQCDLDNENEILRTMEWVEKTVGVVEILINNAAIDLPSLLIEGGMEEWKKSMDVNVMSAVLLIKEMLRLLKKRGLNSGVIININDVCAWHMMHCNRPISISHATTKHALRGLTDHLRMKLSHMQSNVKVISIVPGLVDTEMTQLTLRDKPRLALKPKDVADAVIITLQTPETVLIQDLVITPLREVTM